MRYTFFEIENFKGIEQIRMDLDESPSSNVYTLVGLNESGKTTILEAINFFSYKQETLEPLDLPRYTITDVHDLIPISKRENFNGNISITVGLSLDNHDESEIRRHIFKKYKIRLSDPINTIEITQELLFANSKYINKSITWYINLSGTRERQRKARDLEGDEWQGAISYIKTLIPTILYFPNFLFDFPNKIFLEDYSDVADSGKHKFYRDVIQDILDALESGTNIETHILGRAKSGDKNDKKHLDSLLLSMGRNITEIVFNAWNKIFGIQVSDKEIIVGCDSESNKYYLEFKLKDSDGFYLISERSLGFRWFFVFLLLTQYRGYRKKGPKNVLFLLDEPASNLHATAQIQLINSLDKLRENSKVIYTTHSHYMINPDWLEGIFVVKNEGLDYRDDDIKDYSAKKTKIIVERYRSFAVKYPDQKTYFQPILDILDYCPAKLEMIPNVVMLEGKDDFYTINYFNKIIIPNSPKLYLLPGCGAGSLAPIISLYIGWGSNFVVLLDSDHEGIKQKQRYVEKFGLVIENKLFSLVDIDGNWKDFGLEKLIPEDERVQFQKTAYPDCFEYNKTHFHRSIQEHLIRKKPFEFLEETKIKFQKILHFIDEKLKEISE